MPMLSSVLGPPVRMPPEVAPAPDQSCGGWFPKWRETRVSVQREGSGLSGLGDGGAWLQPPLHLGSASARNPRGAGSPPLGSRLPAPRGHSGSGHAGKYGPAGPLQLPTLRRESRDRDTPRMSHPNTVHINSRPFRSWVCACLSVFLGVYFTLRKPRHGEDPRKAVPNLLPPRCGDKTPPLSDGMTPTVPGSR